MTALALDLVEVGVDQIPIQCHREGIGTTMVIMIVTRLGVGRRTLINRGKCIQKNSKDVLGYCLAESL